jgi:hypothetical protein
VREALLSVLHSVEGRHGCVCLRLRIPDRLALDPLFGIFFWALNVDAISQFLQESDVWAKVRIVGLAIEQLDSSDPELRKLIDLALSDGRYLLFMTALDAMFLTRQIDRLVTIIRSTLNSQTTDDQIMACLNIIPSIAKLHNDLPDYCRAMLSHSNPEVSFAALEAMRIMVGARTIGPDDVLRYCKGHMMQLPKKHCEECLVAFICAPSKIALPAGFFDELVSSEDWEIRDLAVKCRDWYRGDSS